MRFLFNALDLKNLTNFILREEFTTADAAPVASPRIAEPGPGSWTIVDTQNYLAISGGELVVTATAGGNWGNPRLNSPNTIARASGLAFFVAISAASTGSGSLLALGFGNGPITGSYAGHEALSFRSSVGYLFRADGEQIINPIGQGTDAPEYAAIILRSSGYFALSKSSTTADWKILWVFKNSNADPLTPSASFAGQINFNISFPYMRFAQLPAPWTDDQLITDSNATPIAGNIFTHEADSWNEFVMDTLPTAGAIDIQFRKQDNSNLWDLRLDNSGDLVLYEIVAGGWTARGTAAGVLSGGERIALICDDETIAAYYDGTLAWNYSSAANFKTATDGKINTLGTGGAISNLITWPRTPSGKAQSILEAHSK